MKFVVLVLAFAAIAHAHVLVAPGPHLLSVGSRPFFVVPRHYGGVPHVNPVTVIFVSHETVDKPKDVAEVPVTKDTPPVEEPAVSAKPAFPAPGDADEMPPSTKDETNGGMEEVSNTDGPLEEPNLNGNEDDDGLDFKKTEEDTPAVFAKPAFNTPEDVGDGDATEVNSEADEKKPAKGSDAPGVTKEPYVPYVHLPSGVFRPVLGENGGKSKTQDNSVGSKPKGGVYDDNAYYVGYVVSPVPQAGSYPYYAPHVVYAPIHHGYIG